MNGAHIALGAATALVVAAGLQGSRGSSASAQGGAAAPRPVEAIERPHLFFDSQPARLRQLVLQAAALQQGPDPEGATSIMEAVVRDSRLFVGRSRFEIEQLAREMVGSLMFRSLVDYVVHGQQSFAVGPRLQEMFKETALPSEMEAWMLRVPYPAFYIALPECSDKIWGTYDTFSHVRGVMVDTEYMPGHMALLISAPIKTELLMAHHGISSGMTEVERGELSGGGNDSYIIFNIEDAVADPRGIEYHILDRWQRFVSDEGWPSVAVKTTAEARLNVLKIVLGSILYLQSDRRDLSLDARMVREKDERGELEARARRTKNPAKRKKAEEQLRSLPSGAVTTWLGRQIEEGAGLDEAPASTDARRPLRRHWVRGHWRRPARKHGPRELRWIQPFLRGAGEAVVSRIYELEEPK